MLQHLFKIIVICLPSKANLPKSFGLLKKKGEFTGLSIVVKTVSSLFFSFIKVIVYQRTEQKGHEISSESDADSYESNIRERLLFLTNDKSKSCAEIVANLEKKFFF